MTATLPPEAHAALAAELKALQKENDDLNALILDLVMVLRRAAAQFHFYAEEHLRQKKLEKYQTNYDYATMCRYAIKSIETKVSK